MRTNPYQCAVAGQPRLDVLGVAAPAGIEPIPAPHFDADADRDTWLAKWWIEQSKKIGWSGAELLQSPYWSNQLKVSILAMQATTTDANLNEALRQIQEATQLAADRIYVDPNGGTVIAHSSPVPCEITRLRAENETLRTELQAARWANSWLAAEDGRLRQQATELLAELATLKPPPAPKSNAWIGRAGKTGDNYGLRTTL